MRWVLRMVGAFLALLALVLLAGWSLSASQPPRPDILAGHMTLTLAPVHRDTALTLHLWYPARPDGTAVLIGHNALFHGAWAAEGATPASGMHPLVLFSHGSGGNAALALGGARLSKRAFLDYCDRATGQLDCGWMQDAGVDFTTIDASRYEADLSDPRIARVIAIDPALTPAMTQASLAALPLPVLILNLGAPETLPLGLNAAPAATQIPAARYEALTGAQHFSFLAPCSALGRIVIGLAGEDSICSDSGLRPRAEIHADILDRTLAFLARP